MIYTARKIQEKSQEQNLPLFMTFTNLNKALNNISQENLWKVVVKFG